MKEYDREIFHNKLKELFYKNKKTILILEEIKLAQSKHDFSNQNQLQATIMTMVGLAFQITDPKHKSALGIQAVDEICAAIAKLKETLKKHDFNPKLERVIETAEWEINEDSSFLGDLILDGNEKFQFLDNLEHIGNTSNFLSRLENMVSIPPENYRTLIQVRKSRDISDEQHESNIFAANSIGNLARHFREMGVHNNEIYRPWVRYFYRNLLPKHFEEKGKAVSKFIIDHSK